MTKEQEESIKILKEDLSKARNSMFFETSTAVVEIVLNLIQQIQEENKQKDKMINLTLEEYEYNARINIKYFCDEEMRKNTCIQDCKLCIKQYFEKKTEKEELK